MFIETKYVQKLSVKYIVLIINKQLQFIKLYIEGELSMNNKVEIKSFNFITWNWKKDFSFKVLKKKLIIKLKGVM